MAFVFRIARNVVLTTMLAGVLALITLMILAERSQNVAAPAPGLAGKLLVATPNLADPNFYQTVIYVIRDDRHGTLGLVINRPFERRKVADLMGELKGEMDDLSGEIDLYVGGPVEPQQGFVLHSSEYATTDTFAVSDDIAVSRSRDILSDIGHGAGPRAVIFCLGYAGWRPGQLDQEITAGAWDIIDADLALIFAEPAQQKWNTAQRMRGIDL